MNDYDECIERIKKFNDKSTELYLAPPKVIESATQIIRWCERDNVPCPEAFPAFDNECINLVWEYKWYISLWVGDMGLYNSNFLIIPDYKPQDMGCYTNSIEGESRTLGDGYRLVRALKGYLVDKD